MYKRIIISIILIILTIITSLGFLSYLTVDDTIDRSMQRRVDLARMIARYTDSILESNFNRLYDISLSGSVDLKDKNWEPEKKALESAYQYSIFTDGIFLLDKEGATLLTYPPRLGSSLNLSNAPDLGRVLVEGKPAISDVYTVEPSRKKVIYVMVPLKSKDGEIIGVAGGEINPTNYMLGQVIKSAPSGPNTTIEIVDSRGIVIVSSNPSRIFTGSDHDRFLANLISLKMSAFRRCHRCHVDERTQVKDADRRSNDVLAFSPLEIAPWGVSILQPEKDVFAPAMNLRKTFLIFSVISIGIALLIAVGMSRSIVKPVHELIDATHSIASGDMSRSIGFGGVDEIGMLSTSFEVMRVKLADSLESLHQYNIELERRVSERTREIDQSHKKVEKLLNKVITAQEEERKRVARGLHDETMQSLSAALMKIDTCLLYGEHSQEKIGEIRTIVLDTLEAIRTMIQNLRPSILDDLGLEASIRWLLDKHLWERGITYFYNIIGDHSSRFDPQFETTLFRIIQEVIVNIARHAEAENVFFIMKLGDHDIKVDIEDDGKGFDVRSALKRTEDGRGLGILGLKERVYLIDGKVLICSEPGCGTRISLWIPLKSHGDEYV